MNPRWTKMWLLLCWLGMLAGPMAAQYKYERESRIDAEEVPEKARAFFEEIQPTAKDKWYREENLQGSALELKMRKDGTRYSIKFTEEGEIVDLEKEVEWRAIPKEVREEIEEELEEEFDRYRIEKIQEQYRGKAKHLIAYIQTGQQRKVKKSLQYEIVLKGKREGKYHLYEAVFDREGDDESIERILTPRTDNMEF